MKEMLTQTLLQYYAKWVIIASITRLSADLDDRRLFSSEIILYEYDNQHYIALVFFFIYAPVSINKILKVTV